MCEEGRGSGGRRHRRQFEPVAEGRHHILQRALEVDRRLCLVAELQPSDRVLPRDTQRRSRRRWAAPQSVGGTGLRAFSGFFGRVGFRKWSAEWHANGLRMKAPMGIAWPDMPWQMRCRLSARTIAHVIAGPSGSVRTS